MIISYNNRKIKCIEFYFASSIVADTASSKDFSEKSLY